MDTEDIKNVVPDPSPFSSTTRKRKNEEIEESLKSGEYYEKDFSTDFTIIIAENGDKIDRIRCRKCSKIFSSGAGGHRTTHDINLDSLQLPSAHWLRNQVESKGEEIFRKIANELAVPIEKKEACLVLDFGKKVHDFLSVFITFIDRSGEKPQLKALPFMFMPIFGSKRAEQVVEYILDGGERLNFTRDQILSLRIVGDGGSNIKKLEDYFKSYSLCSCHSLQKAAERILSPLEIHETSFHPDEAKKLKELSNAIDNCGELACLLRRYRNIHNLKKLPVVYCRTRWLTFITCCQDIIDVFPVLETLTDARVLKLREKIRPMLPQLITCMTLLKMFEVPLKMFEKTAMRLNEVAPYLFKLKNHFSSEKEKAAKERNFVLATVAKSAFISISHYIKKTVSDPHLLATYMCPGMRTLSLFPDEYKTKTLELIKEEVLNVQIDAPAVLSNPNHLILELYDAPPPPPSALTELFDYENAKLSTEDTLMIPMEFWEKHKSRFPRMAQVAGTVFCTIASESICERSFSTLNRLFRSDRQSLDPEFVETLMVSFLYLNNCT
ncbi:hypothetical protein CAEBREN_10242 [Caenorhabditis brenneri]|uniref:HAT C-terminal dimerisation domain-containing protein n=1 Tax=Caenorhabditis brenneri TaxID=135651 RepID=G0NVJ4_CAEBE|nr:hypothetical protein CAEBREN_10242 [Caenorhabditis brenneri]